MPSRPPRMLARLALGVALSWTLVAGAASAQNLYLEGHFGGSQGTVDVQPDLDQSTIRQVRNASAEDDDDNSIVGGAAIGFRFPISWALDAELPRYVPDALIRLEQEVAFGRDYDAFTNNDINIQNAQTSTSLDAWSLMTNFWLEIPVWRSWSLIGGVGIGPVFLDAKTRNDLAFLKGSDDDERFAWQAGTGIEYAFDETVTMGFAYRYFDAEEIKVNVDQTRPNIPVGEAEFDLDSHEFMMRLRVNFYHFR